ncbi:putative transposase [uncultured archaeon]|nr:putative transposase [uncultured archaeon]
MIRTYTTRLKVARKQNTRFEYLLSQLCKIYNMALEQRKDAWMQFHTSLSQYDQHKELTELRVWFPEYEELPAAIERDPLHRLQLAFNGFYRRAKKEENPGYPRFKSATRYDSFSVDSQNFKFDFIKSQISLVGLGTFHYKTHFKIAGEPKQIHVKRCGKRWQAQVVCDIGPAPEKKPVHKSVGIDLGLTTLVTCSDGAEIENPRWAKQEADKLAEANRFLSRKKRNSNNRSKAKENLRRCHQRIKGKRNAYLHEVTQKLIDSYDLIAYETLKINNMVKSHLAKSILDAAWGELIYQLKYKAEETSISTVAVNPRNTSQLCSGCGRKVPKDLSQRIHACPFCGLVIGRDLNAALNILDRGMRSVVFSTRGSN